MPGPRRHSPDSADPADAHPSQLRDLRKLPKAHLHVHLFGSIRRETVADLAAAMDYTENQTDLLLTQIAGVSSMAEFLWLSRAVQNLVRTPEDVVRICREFVEDEAAAGVVHTQPSFVPHDFARLFQMDVDDLFTLMDDAFQEAGRVNGVHVTYEIAPNRIRDAAYLREAAEFAVRHRDHGVTTFGFGGDERVGHEVMGEAVAIARAGGLRIDPHAGETVGAESVATALEMAPDSLAHGVTADGDPEVTSRLVRLRIPCHVSIHSNAALGVVAGAADHPVRRLLGAGVAVTLNADDTTFFATSVAQEMETARTALGMTDAELAQLARNSLHAAPMRDVDRRIALAGVDHWLRGVDRGLN